jgi:hypothetical protein
MKLPTNRISKHLVRILKKNLTLNNNYNVVNSTNLAIDLTNLKIKENHKLITYDIKDFNIPIEETLTITKSMLLKNNDTQIMQQIIPLMRLIPSQNYFTFQNKTYQPDEGVSMGSPVSSTIAEVFLKPFRVIYVKQLLETKKKTIFCTRYVGDIYDTKRTHPDLINTYINQIHIDIKLSPTYENNGCISFLDLLIIRKPSNLETDIFRKPTTTDTNINFL